MASSASNASRAAFNSPMRSSLSAFSAFGRLSRMSPTLASVSTMMFSYFMAHALRFDDGKINRPDGASALTARAPEGGASAVDRAFYGPAAIGREALLAFAIVDS